jgi:hypothetical protein
MRELNGVVPANQQLQHGLFVERRAESARISHTATNFICPFIDECVAANAVPTTHYTVKYNAGAFKFAKTIGQQEAAGRLVVSATTQGSWRQWRRARTDMIQPVALR